MTSSYLASIQMTRSNRRRRKIDKKQLWSREAFRLSIYSVQFCYYVLLHCSNVQAWVIQTRTTTRFQNSNDLRLQQASPLVIKNHAKGMKTFVQHRHSSIHQLKWNHPQKYTQMILPAKRRNNRPSEDDLDHWYDEIDQNKSPDDIFWEEMERQRLIDSNGDSGSSGVSNNNNNGPYLTGRGMVGGGSIPVAGGTGGMMMGAASGSYASTSSFSSLLQQTQTQFQQQQQNSNTMLTPQQQQKLKQQQQISLKNVDATLSEYEAYMVSDNWLDDDLVEFMMSNDETFFDADKFYEGVPSLDEQLDEWAADTTTSSSGGGKRRNFQQQPATASKQQQKQQRQKQNGATTGSVYNSTENSNTFNAIEEDDDDEEEDDEEDDDDYEYFYDDDDNNVDTEDDNAWMQSDEPWDHWSETTPAKRTSGLAFDPYDDDRVVMDPDKVKYGPASQFLYDVDDDTVDDDDEAEKREYLHRLSKITISSERLQRAKDSTKAKAFFSRKPDAMEGFDRLWVSAIDNVCFSNLVGTFRNYGVEFADNFGDWEDQSIDDTLAYTIEEIASYKARQVYDVTGLPCIASRTSWEIEPIPDWNRIMPTPNVASIYPSAAAAANNNNNNKIPSGVMNNPRVVSGYRFNDVGMHVDYISDALRPISDPNRVARFKTCLCFYDGEMEIFDYGTLDVDLYFCNSMRTFIPVAQAINEMMKTLELAFGLEYQKWLRTRIDEANSVGGSSAGGRIQGRDGEMTDYYGAASMKLRDRVLKEGKVLPNDIIDVSAFMDSMVDVNLMDECASELANRFLDQKPTKILTVATTGLVIALPMAKYLQVPVVYARKERNVVMAETYIAGYSSKTVGKNRELLISRSHLQPEDRILIVDDFLSSGSSQEALLRIVAESGATSVGIGVLLEKVYDSGRQSLSGFDIPIHSLCRIASVMEGVIQLIEEEGFDRMAAATSTSTTTTGSTATTSS